MTLLVILLVGAATGFLGGLFGKGGSALATPVLAAFGVPPLLAVAGPLPATIPGTLLAARQYARRGLIDRRVVAWCVAVGVPATVAGALLTGRVPAGSLVLGTDVLVLGLGIGILVGARRGRTRARDASLVALDAEPGSPAPDPADPAPGGVAALDLTEGGAPDDGGAVLVTAPARARQVTVGLVAVAAGTGFVAGLLANSGGFLLAPLFLLVLRLPVRSALGTSLAVSAALAVPGSLTHAALGHLDLGFVLAFAAASVPLSAVGARTALRIDPERLEVAFGAALVVLSTALLAWG